MTVDQWANFAVLVGGASAALSGLLFVAVSLNIKRIAASGLLREAAAKTLVVLLTPLLITILIVVPGQFTWLLGVELIAIGLLTGLVSTLVQEQPVSEHERRRARIYRVLPPTLVTTVLVLLAGLFLVTGWGRALYFVPPAVIAAFLFGVANAWLLMVRLTHEETDITSRSY